MILKYLARKLRFWHPYTSQMSETEHQYAQLLSMALTGDLEVALEAAATEAERKAAWASHG